MSGWPSLLVRGGGIGMSVKMETTFAGVTFKNPVSTCSGTYGFGIEYGRFVPVERLGSITTKGLSA